MQKAVFFEEAYKNGTLKNITDGYIFSVNAPDITNTNKKCDPFLLEIVNFRGLKAIYPHGNGVKFQAQGKKMFCMLEPANYSKKQIEPAMRSTGSTEYMPYRFTECNIFFTKDAKYRVLIPTKAFDCFDSFTIEFPDKGDLCILYYIFDKDDIMGVVIPYIQDNIGIIIKTNLGIQDIIAKKISKQFMAIVKELYFRP